MSWSFTQTIELLVSKPVEKTGAKGASGSVSVEACEKISLVHVSNSRRPPQQIGGAIQELLARFDSDGRFEIVRLIRVWPEVVGEAISRRTEIAGFKFHTAVVKVSGAMWIQELSLMKPQLLARLQDRIGADVVRDLRFVQGRLSRREKPRLRAVPRNVRRSIDLPSVTDPELRKAFAGLIEAWGRSSR